MRARPISFVAGAAVLGALAVTACAPVQGADGTGATAQAAPRKCLYQNDVRSFRVSQDARNVYVRGLDKTVYRLSVMGSCPELDTAMAIGFAPMGGMNSLCTGDYTRLVAGGAPTGMPCNVRLTGALTEAEVAALPERDRP
ncbi:DUF6491 family protein [Brevundimonas diminuta]|uniref:DUF6491 family protein n=1 Tax=Brevundimonas diminuta TaxID=293 RepID=UPI003207A597